MQLQQNGTLLQLKNKLKIMYAIISKIELEGANNLKYSDYGYTTDQTTVNQINEDYDSRVIYNSNTGPKNSPKIPPRTAGNGIFNSFGCDKNTNDYLASNERASSHAL